MKKIKIMVLVAVLGSTLFLPNLWKENVYSKVKPEKIILPQPEYKSKISVERALQNRRSVKSYKDEAVTLKELSQLLWAAQGVTSDRGGRTAQSVGGKYSLEIFAVVGEVKGLDPGIYRYDPNDHSLIRSKKGDLRDNLTKASLGQPSIRNAPVDLVITGVYARTQEKYGDRGRRYVHLEAGLACQNISLQAETLKLGTAIIETFRDDEVGDVLRLRGETPLAIMPVGKTK